MAANDNNGPTISTDEPDNDTCPELKPYERAARLLCAKRGVNPDDFKDVPHPTIRNMSVRVYRWQSAAEELIDFSAMLLSLREAAGGMN